VYALANKKSKRSEKIFYCNGTIITSHIKNRTFASSYSFFKYSIYLKKCIYTVFKKRITAGKSSILNMISNKRDIVRY
jgi:hypothetical protein